MLPFGGFPLREGACVGSPIQVSTVLRLHAPTRGCIAACRALRQLSSRAILQTALACSGLGGVYWRLVKPYILCCCVAFGLCVVSCELFLCVKIALSTLHSHLFRRGVAFLMVYDRLLNCLRSAFP